MEEITLLYVALTRAQKSLLIPDSILHAINLSKYCRDPFSSLKPTPKLNGGVHLASPTSHSADLPERPELPSKFARVDSTSLMSKKAVTVFRDDRVKSPSMPQSSVPSSEPQQARTEAVKNEKLEMLVSKFKK